MPWGSRTGHWSLAPAAGVAARVVGRQGHGRAEMQDAWAIATRGPAGDEPPMFAAGVFDGVGGHANGRAASSAAARALRVAVRDERDPAAVLRAISPRVARSGGFTTGLLIMANEGEGNWRVAWRGDGTIWVRNPGKSWRRVAGSLDSEQPLQSYLGRDTATHEARIHVEPGGRVALATDGVPKTWLDVAKEPARLHPDTVPAHGDDDAMLLVLERAA